MAPTTLMASPTFQRGSRSRQWCTTMPVWDSVKPVKTPTAYSGMRAEVSPPKTMISTPARAARTMMPLENTSRSPRLLQLAGQEAVTGDDRAEAGEVGVGGVGREDQDGERGELQHVVHDAAGAEDGAAHEGQDRLPVLLGDRLEVGCQHAQPEEAAAEDDRHPDQRRRRVARLRLLERRHAVGDGLHARQGHGAGREGPHQEEQRDRAERLAVVGELREELLLVRGSRRGPGRRPCRARHRSGRAARRRRRRSGRRRAAPTPSRPAGSPAS